MRLRNKVRRFEALEPRHLLAAELVAHWLADDLVSQVNDGEVITSWTDRVQGVEATAAGRPQLAEDQFDGRAVVRFDRFNDADLFTVDAADSPMSGADDFTIAVTFASDSTSLNGGTAAWFLNTGLVDGTGFFGTTADWGLVVNSMGQVGAGLGKPATSLYSTASGLNDGQLHVAVYSRSGGTLSLTIDDQPTQVMEGGGTEPRIPTELTIGAISGGSFAYTGDLAEVRIYDDDLTADELDRLVFEIQDYYTNFAPQASDDSYDVDEDASLQVPAAMGVLQNDSDADQTPLTAELVSPADHGSVELNQDGSFTYLPDADYFGLDRFTYQASDGSLTSELAEVIINVLPQPDHPRAMSDSFLIAPDRTASIDARLGLLNNDEHPDALPMMAVTVDDVSHGVLQLSADGSFVYEPGASFAGEDRFTYKLTDGVRESDVVAVELLAVTSDIVRISEIMAGGGGPLVTRTRVAADGIYSSAPHTPDWVEIENLTDKELNLGGAHLTDRSNQPTRWPIPPGTTVAPQGHLIIFASGADISDPLRDELGYLHTDFRLDSSGEYLALTTTDGALIHEFSQQYPPQPAGVSYGIDGEGFSFFVAPTPGVQNGEGRPAVAAEPLLSQAGGFYERPFEVSIAGLTPGTQIRYTLDGSEPTGDAGEIYTAPIPIDGTTVLRARSVGSDYVQSPVVTQTYLFLDDVVRQNSQSTVAAGFPTSWNGTGPDYGLDHEAEFPLIAGDVNLSLETARERIVDSLRAVPTVSLVMDLDDLFGNQGIYSHPTSSGPDWERPTAVQWFDTDGNQAFEIDAGLRIQGGAFRSFDLTKKKSFRLLFKDIYGPSKLDYPVFGTDAAQSFDTLTFRMESNDGWQWNGAGSRPQYARDEFARRTQLAMGQPASHGRYVHLYLNGFYWGLYNLVERPDESFAEAYFGVDGDSWDGINSGAPPRAENVINADQNPARQQRGVDAWQELLALSDEVARASTQAEKTAAYMRVLGRNPDGSPNAMLESFLDAEQMIDYLLVNYYGGNLDWPQKNYYVGREQGPQSEGFKFFAWDSEWTLLLQSQLSTNRIGAISGAAEPFSKLRSSDEFRLQFADRVQQHFFNGGPLYVNPDQPDWDPANPQHNVPAARYAEITSEVFEALLAESARWGDQHRSQAPYTRDVEWVATRETLMRDWFPRRSAFVLSHLRNAGLYPDIETPVFDQRGGFLCGDCLLTLNSAADEIYYTTDGSDPRQVGGGVSPGAIRYTGPISLATSSLVTVRAMQAGEWSARDQATFTVDAFPADANSLRVSEVHYHPSDPTAMEVLAGYTDADDFEFIELVNTSGVRIDLSQVQLVQTESGEGVQFDFAGSSIRELEPNGRVLVVEDMEAFHLRYGDGLPVAGEWTGRLSNGSELLTLTAHQTILQQFSYDDAWHPSSDGAGASLEMVDPTSTDLTLWSRANGWRPSSLQGGSPGSGAPLQVRGDFDADGDTDTDDVDALFSAVRTQTDVDRFDLTGDRLLDDDDLDTLVVEILQTRRGDINLDRRVTVAEDGQRVLENLGRSGVGWSGGDFDGDGRTTASLDGAALLAALAADWEAIDE